MEKHGKAWKSMEKHGNTWTNIENHGKALKNMEKHGKTWKSMENHGKPLDTVENHQLASAKCKRKHNKSGQTQGQTLGRRMADTKTTTANAWGTHGNRVASMRK